MATRHPLDPDDLDDQHLVESGPAITTKRNFGKISLATMLALNTFFGSYQGLLKEREKTGRLEKVLNKLNDDATDLLQAISNDAICRKQHVTSFSQGVLNSLNNCEFDKIHVYDETISFTSTKNKIRKEYPILDTTIMWNDIELLLNTNTEITFESPKSQARVKISSTNPNLRHSLVIQEGEKNLTIDNKNSNINILNKLSDEDIKFNSSDFVFDLINKTVEEYSTDLKTLEQLSPDTLMPPDIFGESITFKNYIIQKIEEVKNGSNTEPLNDVNVYIPSLNTTIEQMNNLEVMGKETKERQFRMLDEDFKKFDTAFNSAKNNHCYFLERKEAFAGLNKIRNILQNRNFLNSTSHMPSHLPHKLANFLVAENTSPKNHIFHVRKYGNSSDLNAQLLSAINAPILNDMLATTEDCEKLLNLVQGLANVIINNDPYQKYALHTVAKFEYALIRKLGKIIDITIDNPNLTDEKARAELKSMKETIQGIGNRKTASLQIPSEKLAVDSITNNLISEQQTSLSA